MYDPEYPKEETGKAGWFVVVCVFVFGVLPMGWLAYESSKPQELFAEYGSGAHIEAQNALKE